MVTSSSNPQMKRIVQLNKKAKTRYEQRVFVAEGIKMCQEAPKGQIETLYVSESFLAEPKNQGFLEDYSYEVVSDKVFSAVSDTKTPQGILCLVKMPQYSLEKLLGDFNVSKNGDQPMEKCPHLLILEGIQDPGNLGTMMRTAEGAGVTGIVMSKTTVDIFNPKVVRSTMGSLFRVPFYLAEDLAGTINFLKKQGIIMYAAHLKGKLSYDQPDYRGACGFLIGNEGNGLTPETAALADQYIRIPMEGRVESLNASIAAALLMYETHRQRR